ncbi:MAG: ribonuclease D [Myxococcales bacterium]|nr:ribonuclease D [Myxococcales bacterium]
MRRAPHPLSPTVHLVVRHAQLRRAVEALQCAAVVGLDVETTWRDHRLCLVQLAVDDEVFVIDALGVPDWRALLAPLLGSPRPVKVVHNASFERRILGNVGLELDGVFDTLSASRRLRGKQPDGHGLAAVCRRELGFTLDKGPQMSDWARRPLSTAQLRYAALDAAVLPLLYARLSPPRLL